jgi:hypothetical protein
MINGHKPSVVLEDHDLVFRVPVFWISPIVYRDLHGLGTVFARHVKYATSWNVLLPA